MVQLFNLRTGQFEDALLACPIEQQDIDCYSGQWRPLIDDKVQELRAHDRYTREGLGEFHIQDASWEWPEKFADRAGQLGWSSMAVRCDGRTQGMMYLNLLRRCRLPDQAHQHSVYVELLAKAPWNRATLVEGPQYAGIGIVMMAEAIQASIDEGFSGRVGLHALPQADDFYEKKCGMTKMGADAGFGGLTYFEFASEDAQKFLWDPEPDPEVPHA